MCNKLYKSCEVKAKGFDRKYGISYEVKKKYSEGIKKYRYLKNTATALPISLVTQRKDIQQGDHHAHRL